MLAADHQWPTNAVPPPTRLATGSESDRNACLERLNAFFSKRFGARAFVLPSGRAAMSLAMRLEQIDRRHVVFAPRWSSTCVWSILGHYGNPTCRMDADVDVVLAVHKYGFVETTSHHARLVIEDSCDSIPLDATGLFPNAGVYEILSLPKIMGTYGGGVLLCRDASKAAAIDEATRSYGELNAHQGQLRHALATRRTSPLETWDALEHRNFAAGYGLLLHLEDALPALDRNVATIERRLLHLQTRAPELIAAAGFSEHRLGPVLPVSLPSRSVDANTDGLMIRRINDSASLDFPHFVPKALLPLHFGISDDDFEQCLARF